MITILGFLCVYVFSMFSALIVAAQKTIPVRKEGSFRKRILMASAAMAVGKPRMLLLLTLRTLMVSLVYVVLLVLGSDFLYLL